MADELTKPCTSLVLSPTKSPVGGGLTVDLASFYTNEKNDAPESSSETGAARPTSLQIVLFDLKSTSGRLELGEISLTVRSLNTTSTLLEMMFGEALEIEGFLSILFSSYDRVLYPLTQSSNNVHPIIPELSTRSYSEHMLLSKGSKA